MNDLSRAFEVLNGVDIQPDEGVEGPFITGGIPDPTGLDLPERTLYLQNVSSDVVKVWLKSGVGVNDWRRMDGQDLPFDPTGLVNFESSDTDVKLALERLGAQTLAELGRGESFFNDDDDSTSGNGWPDVTTFTTDIARPMIVGTYEANGVIEGGQTDKEKQFGFRMRSREVGSGTWITRFQYDSLSVGTDGGIIPIPFKFEFDINPEQVQHEFLLEFGNTDNGGSALYEQVTWSFSRVSDI